MEGPSGITTRRSPTSQPVAVIGGITVSANIIDAPGLELDDPPAELPAGEEGGGNECIPALRLWK